MAEDEGRMRYIWELDLSKLRQDAKEGVKVLEELSSSAVRQGSVIDRAFGETGAARSFNTFEAALRGATTGIKDFALGDAQENIAKLSAMVRDNESVLALETKRLGEYRAAAEEAFNSGDTGRLDAITKDIDEQIVKINSLVKETGEYEAALHTVMEMAGMGNEAVVIPRLYKNEEDLQAVEDLRERVTGLTAELQEAIQNGGDTTALREQLDEAKGKLGEMETEAGKAAAVLGEDLGGRAAEAQQRLHELNNAVNEQQGKVDELTSALESAEKAYSDIQKAGDADVETMSQMAATVDTLTNSLQNATDRLSALQGAQRDAQSAWADVSREVETHDGVMVKMLGGYDNYRAILGQLPQPLQSVIGGITGMTGAAKTFIATPLGAIIAAIVIALQALKSWFDSSSEGQRAFAQITGYVSGVLGQLKEIVIAVGNAIYKAFKDPKQAITELWNAIKENIVNRFSAIGDMAGALGRILKAAFTLDVDGIKSGMKDLTNSLLQLGTGVENVTGKIKDWAGNVREAAEESASISTETKDLEREVSEWQKRNAELEQLKAEARGKMYNTSLSAEERRAAQKEYEAALQEQADTEARFADKRIELQKRSMALTTNGDEDVDKLNRLEAERTDVMTRQAQELAQLQRRANAIDQQADKGASDLEREKQQRMKALETIGDMEVQMQQQNTKQEIAAMDEGHAQKMARLADERDKELAHLRQTQEKFKVLNAQAGLDTGDDGLTESQRSQIEQSRVGIESNYRDGVRDILQDELSDIMTYEQKRQAVEETYAKRRADLYTQDEDGNMQLREGVSQGNVDELDRQATKALQAVDEEFAQREDTYEAWCNEVANASLDQLEQMIEVAKEKLSEAEASGASGSELASAKASVTKAEQQLQKTRSKQTSGDGTNGEVPDKRSIKQWSELYNTLQDVNRSFEKIGDSVGGVAGEVIKTAGQVASSATTMVNGIMQLVQGTTQGIVGTATAAATAIQMVEKASVILTIIAAALEIIQVIAGLFNNDASYQKEIEGLQRRIDQLQWELDNAAAVTLQENFGKAIDKVTEAVYESRMEIVGAKLAVGDWKGAYDAMYKSVAKDNNLLISSTEKLVKEYATLGYTVDKTIGTAKYDASAQLKNLSEQMVLVNQQLEDEQAKKKTDKDQVAEYKQQLEELGEEMATVINDMMDDIIGYTSEELASELGNAFFDAFENGENAAEAWGDTVNDIVGDIVKNMLITDVLEEQIGQIYNKYKGKWYSDEGVFLGAEAVNDSMQGFAADLNAVYDEFETVWNGLDEGLKDLMGVGEDTREAAEKGIATASQESVDELNGRMTVIQTHTYTMNENVKMMADNTAAILFSILSIESYSQRMNENIDTIRTYSKEMRDTVNDISTKGLKLYA